MRVNKPRVSARIGAIAESATLAVDAKAKALKAAGRPVIGFGAGEPDFPTPDYIVEAAVAACRDPKWHRYTPAGGLPELKTAIAAKTLRDSGFVVDPSQVLITNGGKQALYNAFAALLDPGDEVLLPAPYWTTYPESIRLAGGIPVEIMTDESTGYRTSIAQLEKVYGDAEFSSMPVLVPELADKCIIVNGVAKTYAMTGWRVGWMIGPNDIVKAATNLQSHATSNVANVSQIAALAAVSGDLSAVDEMKVAFDRRRKLITKMLNEIEGVNCPEPEGAFYVYPSVKNILGREIRGKVPTTSAELSALILDEVEVAVVPGEAFGTPGYIRLSYALGDDDLIEGISRVQDLLK